MAYKKIQFKRGSKAGMPVLRSGEPGFTQDEKSLYIGDGTSNQRFLNEIQIGTKIDEKIAPVTQSITDNVVALNQTINTKEQTLDAKIADKAKINGEITNVNLISSGETVESVNGKKFASNTDIVIDSTNRTQEQINRVFYKQSCKEFTSDGSPITVNNGMDGYILSGKIEGQTVKNYASDIADSGNITKLNDGWFKAVNTSSYYIGVSVSNRLQIRNGTSYTCFVEFRNINITTNDKVHVGESNKSGTYINDLSISSGSNLETIINGVVPITFTTSKDYENGVSLRILRGATQATSENSCEFRLLGVVETGFIPKGTLQIGLNSTQATIINNGLKYSFYANLEDKLAGKVIELPFKEDTITLNEDGRASWTKAYQDLKLNGTENWELLGGSYQDTSDFTTFAFQFGSITEKMDIPIHTLNFPFYKWNASTGILNQRFISNVNTKRITIRIEKSIATTIEQFKTWLSANNIPIRYQLATPIITHIPKEIMPTVLTQLENQITFGDAVAASKATISLPVNRMADFEARIAQLEKVIASTSNVSILTNYVDDVYNNNQNKEMEMM